MPLDLKSHCLTLPRVPTVTFLGRDSVHMGMGSQERVPDVLADAGSSLSIFLRLLSCEVPLLTGLSLMSLLINKRSRAELRRRNRPILIRCQNLAENFSGLTPLVASILT